MELVKSSVLVLVSLTISHAVTVDQFYPFGAGSGDTLLSDGQQNPSSTYTQQLPFELPLLTSTAMSSYAVSL